MLTGEKSFPFLQPPGKYGSLSHTASNQSLAGFNSIHQHYPGPVKTAVTLANLQSLPFPETFQRSKRVVWQSLLPALSAHFSETHQDPQIIF